MLLVTIAVVCTLVTAPVIAQTPTRAPVKDVQPAIQDKPRPATINGSSHNANESANDDGRLVTVTIWLAVVGGLQFLALIGQAVVFFRQAKIMEQHRTSLEELAKAAGSNAKAAQDNASATKTNTDVLINSERSWLMADILWTADVPHAPYPTTLKVMNGSGVSGETETLDICWVCRNDGNTPAWITEKQLWLKIFQKAPPAIPDTQVGGALVAYGVIRYRDVFGEHETWSGYTVVGDPAHPRLQRLAGYPEYNKNT
jgi:hypothetical protein